MWERFMEAGTGVYVLWGIGLLGVLFKMMVNTYMNKMVKASQSMATTRKKSLRIIRQKFENRKNLNMGFATGEACVDKCVGQLKFLGRPLAAWSHTGQFFSLLICMVMAGGFLYYDVNWRGSPDMIYFLANGTMVCAFLMVAENIFVVSNKLEMLKANIWDYYETMLHAREGMEERPDNRSRRQRAKPEETAQEQGQEKEQDRESAATSVYDARASNQDEVLDSFLREFFT
ncbi:MAG: hypothetical protein ACI4D8_08575 [Wujia sp.]